jgi:hypothetical protein
MRKGYTRTMDNNTTPSQIDSICTALERKYPLARCWFEQFPGRIFIRYATGLSEYITLPQAAAMLAR